MLPTGIKKCREHYSLPLGTQIIREGSSQNVQELKKYKFSTSVESLVLRIFTLLNSQVLLLDLYII